LNKRESVLERVPTSPVLASLGQTNKEPRVSTDSDIHCPSVSTFKPTVSRPKSQFVIFQLSHIECPLARLLEPYRVPTCKTTRVSTVDPTRNPSAKSICVPSGKPTRIQTQEPTRVPTVEPT
jgi:hypothetical protein